MGAAPARVVSKAATRVPSRVLVQSRVKVPRPTPPTQRLLACTVPVAPNALLVTGLLVDLELEFKGFVLLAHWRWKFTLKPRPGGPRHRHALDFDLRFTDRDIPLFHVIWRSFYDNPLRAGEIKFPEFFKHPPNHSVAPWTLPSRIFVTNFPPYLTGPRYFGATRGFGGNNYIIWLNYSM